MSCYWKKGKDKILKIDMTLAGIDQNMSSVLSALRIESYDSNGTLIAKFSTVAAEYNTADYVQLVNYLGDYLLHFAGTTTEESASGIVKHVILPSQTNSNFADASFDPGKDIFFGNLES